MVAETYSIVGRSLRLTWLNEWEKYLGGGVQMAGRRAFEWGIAAGVVLRL
jgi:hypothetical protein